jgi:hypothetical protein
MTADGEPPIRVITGATSLQQIRESLASLHKWDKDVLASRVAQGWTL